MPPRTPEEIANLCSQRVPESLTLEFKRKEDASQISVSRTDRKNISKSISAFANAEGGTLIYGVESNSEEGLDVAVGTQAISQIESFRSQFVAVCAENINPPVRDLAIDVIDAGLGDGAGFLTCEVPRSHLRPHMSTAAGENRYYRRSFTGDLPMTPGEIRDQILAVRDAVLNPLVRPALGGSFSRADRCIAGQSRIEFDLKNTGVALCKNPYLRVKPSCPVDSNSAVLDANSRAWKTDFPYGTLIHVDDQRHCFSLGFHVYVSFDVLASMFGTGSPNLAGAIIVLPGIGEFCRDTIPSEASLDFIDFDMCYGAENAATLKTIVRMTRLEIAKAILTNSTVKSMTIAALGVWRSDLVSSFLISQDSVTNMGYTP